MARDPYGGRNVQRVDVERFTRERERDSFDDRYAPRAEYGSRLRERSVDEEYERRVAGGRSYEDDRIRERVYYDEPDEPRFRPTRESVTIEKERETEREFYNPSPPRRAPVRPGLLRRQSSLDTFDRKPFPRFPEREEYGPPARREDYRPAVPAPMPRYRALPPPRRYAERDYEEIKISEPEFYGDDDYRPYPERVREREIIRTRRRSRSRDSHTRSRSSSSSSSSEVSVRKKFPRRGKTRMPARLVSVKAIIELGYPYEREGETIIIQKALGPDNIDEVIKLSEIYKKSEKVEMSGGRSDGGVIIEERREETITIPSQRGRLEVIASSPQRGRLEVITSPPQRGHLEVIGRTVGRREVSPARISIGRSRSVGPSPIIVEGRHPVEIIESSNNLSVGPLVLFDNSRPKEGRVVRAEVRREGRISGDLIVYETDVVRGRSPGREIIIKKDKKGPNPRAVSTLLKTLT